LISGFLIFVARPIAVFTALSFFMGWVKGGCSYCICHLSFINRHTQG
jgi:hypothetical protein